MRQDRIAEGRPLRRPAFFLLSLALAATVLADAPVDRLIAEARTRRLAEEPEWLTLLHYRRGWLGGWESMVDDPRFFLAPDGKRQPAAELEADLRAFFAPALTNEAEHAVCRFPARLDWLQRRLAFDAAALGAPPCAAVDRVYRHLAPSAVSLVYPAAFMNGPASMFGHTLLLFENADHNRLLAQAVSYAAQTRPTFGPAFAFAGIFGLYPGYYAYQPYYEKVEQYGDIGHRDVWEYELDLEPAEIRRLFLHAWELQGIYSRYFFFDENCAYNLLHLLDVARPGLGVSEPMPWFVIPIDTVRMVREKGIVRRVHYRASPVTRIQYQAGQLDPAEVHLAREVAWARLAAGEVTNRVAEVDRQRRVLDLATDYTQYLYTEELIDRPTYSGRLIDALKVRSRLGRSERNAEEVPVPPRPDLGHAPMRLALGGGVRDGDGFAALRGRIAYHALDDNDSGYTPGAQILFLNTEARWSAASDDWRLERLDIVDVLSLAPRSTFFQPSSWRVRFGIGQGLYRERDELMPQVTTGTGYAWTGGGLDLVYALVEADVQGGDYFRDGWAAGLGPSVGLTHTVGANWKHVVQARAVWMGLGDDLWRLSASWLQDYRLWPDCSLTLELGTATYDTRDLPEASLRVNFYF